MVMTVQNNKKDNLHDSSPIQFSLALRWGFVLLSVLRLGYFLDKYFHTSPYLTILFMFFGIAAAIKTILRLIKQVAKDDERNNGK